MGDNINRIGGHPAQARMQRKGIPEIEKQAKCLFLDNVTPRPKFNEPHISQVLMCILSLFCKGLERSIILKLVLILVALEPMSFILH